MFAKDQKVSLNKKVVGITSMLFVFYQFAILSQNVQRIFLCKRIIFLRKIGSKCLEVFVTQK